MQIVYIAPPFIKKEPLLNIFLEVATIKPFKSRSKLGVILTHAKFLDDKLLTVHRFTSKKMCSSSSELPADIIATEMI